METTITIFGVLIVGVLLYIASELNNIGTYLWKIWRLLEGKEK
jgi:hypothetical protein